MKPDSAITIVRTLRRHGHQAFLVGGCVRDMVMKIEPADYDIATSARPEEVTQIFPRTESVGAQFGVILVIEQGHPFEVATFRSDDAYIDGRRPTSVTFTDVRQDVLRRDFTINGLLYDPETREVIDYVAGQADIQAKIVRAIGDPRLRFEEDKLRILRAVRFGARLGYTIETSTWEAAREMSPQIHQVSRERIREEIGRILTDGQAAHGVRLLHDSGLLREIFPELTWNECIDRSLKMLKAGAAEEFALAVLLHEVAAEKVQAIVERLKFSRLEMHHSVALVRNLPEFNTVRQMSISRLKRFFRANRFEDHLELARIHSVACLGDPSGYQLAQSQFSKWTTADIFPAPLVTGDDLIRLGFRPGPAFKEILTRAEDEQLEGRLTLREQALAFVSANYSAEQE